MSGTWHGTWTRTSPVSGGGSLTFTVSQSGDKLTGTIEQTNSACVFGSVPVTGTVNANAVSIRVDTGSVVADFKGTISGTAMSGSETVTKCPAGVGTADWTVAK